MKALFSPGSIRHHSEADSGSPPGPGSATAMVVIGLSLLLSAGSVLRAADAPTGSIVGWGWDDAGQATPPAGSDYIAVSAGGMHSLAIKSDGSIVGWGIDMYGLQTMPSGSDFIAVDAGFLHSLALTKDGSIVAWGDDSDGQSTPPVGTGYLAICAGGYFSLAIKSDHSIVAWGDNAVGQCTTPAGQDFVAIAAGFNFSLALRKDGSIITWGNVGNAIPPSGFDFNAIATGFPDRLALKKDGSIVAWGWSGTIKDTPPSGHDFVAIAARDQHALALKRDGSIVAWGDNSNGQTDVPTGGYYTAISAGYGHSLALTGEPPKPVLEIVHSPQSHTAVPGSSASLFVQTRGIPGETFEWTFGDTVVGGNSSTLTLADVQAAQSGQYKVKVTANGDSISSRAITLGVKAPPYDTEKMANISTRGQILANSKIMIAGFVLEGSGQKKVLIRGIGPALAQWISGVCTNPKLELFRNTNPATPSIAANEKWGTQTEDIPGICLRVGAFAFEDGSDDAAIYIGLEPGAYTAQVSGLDGTGVGLVELYDADPDPLASSCNLANISTRGEVGTGSQILIAGFVVAGEVPKQLLIRGIGARLADFGVDDTLPDPHLRIYKNASPDPLWVASNDDWADNFNTTDIMAATTASGAFELSPGSQDAVILTWLEPGSYTAQVSGVDEGTGVALVEVYEVK